MLKSILKFILKSAVGQALLSELLELFKAFILKKVAEKNENVQRGIVRKLELDLKDIHVSDFLIEKDTDDELHIIAANLK